jgi:hypothetical protein
MINDMWKLFPRLIEEKINGLLDEAEPNRMKSFQIYKACQYENLWNRSYEDFCEHLRNFYFLPRIERIKSRFDIYLDRPMHKSLFEQFQLDFRNSSVNSSSLMNVSNWAHHMLRINSGTTCQIISLDVMKKTFNSIVNPSAFEKAQDIEFEDFCRAWKGICFNLFGRKYDAELSRVLKELQLLNHEQQQLERGLRQIPRVYLTQTEIDWTEGVLLCAKSAKKIPTYPLSRGPQKAELIEIEKIVQLHSLVFESDNPELMQHLQNVRTTLIFRCEELLKKRQH